MSTITNNLRFPGQYFDAETGSHYNYFRDYNPLIGRYIEADPIGILLRLPRNQLNHLYAYVENNPVNFIDPLGLGPIENGREHLNMIAQQLMNKGYTAEQIVNIMKGLSGSLEYDPAQATTMAAVLLPVIGKAILVGGAAVGGYIVGGLINDIPVAGTNLTTSQWWSNYIWQLTHNNTGNDPCKK